MSFSFYYYKRIVFIIKASSSKEFWYFRLITKLVTKKFTSKSAREFRTRTFLETAWAYLFYLEYIV